jgi:hypothetical protein
MTGRHVTIYEDEHRYVAHPHVAVLPSGEWLLVANRGPRRPVTMHPPQDPEFTNILMRSDDEGATWSPPVVVPAFGVTGTECAGLTILPGGSVLLNQWRFRWYSYLDANAAGDPGASGPDVLKAGLVASRDLDGEGAQGVPAIRLMP